MTASYSSSHHKGGCARDSALDLPSCATLVLGDEAGVEHVGWLQRPATLRVVGVQPTVSS